MLACDSCSPSVVHEHSCSASSWLIITGTTRQCWRWRLLIRRPGTIWATQMLRWETGP